MKSDEKLVKLVKNDQLGQKFVKFVKNDQLGQKLVKLVKSWSSWSEIDRLGPVGGQVGQK